MTAIEEMRKVIDLDINYISLMKARMTKYKSKKMVGGKWVYDYEKPGKAREKKSVEPDKVSARQGRMMTRILGTIAKQEKIGFADAARVYKKKSGYSYDKALEHFGKENVNEILQTIADIEAIELEDVLKIYKEKSESMDKTVEHFEPLSDL